MAQQDSGACDDGLSALGCVPNYRTTEARGHGMKSRKYQTDGQHGQCVWASKTTGQEEGSVGALAQNCQANH
jgi:hypothetical protein